MSGQLPDYGRVRQLSGRAQAAMDSLNATNLLLLERGLLPAFSAVAAG